MLSKRVRVCFFVIYNRDSFNPNLLTKLFLSLFWDRQGQDPVRKLRFGCVTFRVGRQPDAALETTECPFLPEVALVGLFRFPFARAGDREEVGVVQGDVNVLFRHSGKIEANDVGIALFRQVQARSTEESMETPFRSPGGACLCWLSLSTSAASPTSRVDGAKRRSSRRPSASSKGSRRRSVKRDMVVGKLNVRAWCVSGVNRIQLPFIFLLRPGRVLLK
jgi:hypothetical protein